MKITGTHRISAPRERVFTVLTDPECLSRVMPGCKALESTGDGTYTIQLSAGVGPIRGEYQGTVELADMNEPASYRMLVDAKGKTGFVKGEGRVELTEEGEETTVTYEGNVTLGGPVAAVGQRMHSSAAKMMTRQLFGAIEAEATAEEGVEVKHGIIRDTLRGLRRSRP
jgi:carbon monoxide dehydrogenase subunit G